MIDPLKKMKLVIVFFHKIHYSITWNNRWSNYSDIKLLALHALLHSANSVHH